MKLTELVFVSRLNILLEPKIGFSGCERAMVAENIGLLGYDGSGKSGILSILERVRDTLQRLKTDLAGLLNGSNLASEDLGRTVSHIDECYNCLEQLKRVARSPELYYSIRKIFDWLPLTYVSIEAYQNGVISTPVLMSALMKSGIINEIEKIISIMEPQNI